MFQRTVALIYLALATSSYAQDSEVCDLSPPCKQLPTMNITLQEYRSYTPVYELVNKYIEGSNDSVGSCITYFPIDDSSYIVFRSGRITTGSSNLEIYIISDVEGKPGMFRVQGLSNSTSGSSTSVLNAYIVSSGCESCSQFFLWHTCYVLGPEAYVYPADDIIYGAFTSPNPPASCLDQYELLVDQLGFRHSAGFVRASGTLPPCVTRFNNNTCVNFEKVDPANAISYP